VNSHFKRNLKIYMLRSHVSTNNLLQFIQKNIASSNPEVKIRSLIPLVNK